MDGSPTVQDLRRLAEAARALSQATSREAVFELLAQQLTRWFPQTEWAVARISGDPAQAVITHTAGLRGAHAIEQNAALWARTATGRAAVQEGTVVCQVRVGGQPQGVVALVGSEAGSKQRDLDILDLLTASAANAIANTATDSGWVETVDAINIGLCVVATDSTIRFTNRAFAELLERSKAELVGEPCAEVIPSEWYDTIGPMLAPQHAAGPRIVSIQGRRLSVRVYRTGDGASGDRVLLFLDHTDQHRLEEQLVQSEKMSAIGQLIAGVAHDLNNPLASVVGFADFMMETPGLPDQYREPLSVIQQEAERSANIVKNLLTFARKQEGPWRPTVVPKLLDATWELMHNELASNDVELLIEVEPGLPQLDIEPTRIQQVIVNLVTNAAQAIDGVDRRGRIMVRARRWSDGVAIEVSDNGPGIPEDRREQIFEPFYTTKPEGTGTGLGLSISHGIVKEHGGRIQLVGSGDRGTVFRVELPGPSPGAEDAPIPTTRVPVRGLTILVVDDEPHILHYMTATLEAWGHTVHIAHDGAGALERIRDTEFDVIITDLRMPHLSGRQFYQALRDDHPRLLDRVIFSTGDTVRDDTLAFLEQHGRPCLLKPFSLVELRRAIADVA